MSFSLCTCSFYVPKCKLILRDPECYLRVYGSSLAVSMDVDHDLIDNKHGFGEDFLEQLAKDYQWSSLLDGADASPSEILADATPLLIPPISPLLSVKSSPSSSLSDSGSEDDSKNSSSGTSARQSSQSPFDWMCGFDEPSYDLKPEDVELFLQKSVPPTDNKQEPNITDLVRKGPVVSIENGIIEGIRFKTKNCDRITPQTQIPKANGYIQNSYYKVENEHTSLNININDKPVLNQNTKLIEPKTIPSILKRSQNTNPPVAIPDCTNGRKISLSPQPTSVIDSRVSPPRSNIVIDASITQPTSPVQNVIPKSEVIDGVDISNCSEAEIRAIKKQQRMIKNRESACQSRQKKKEYVSALEQQLLKAQHEIARLRLENKLLRDQLDNGRGRKIPRLDTSLFIPKKNIAVIFAMVFMVSLNFNVLGWNSKPFVGPSMPPSNTRHLLWAEENSVSIDTGSEEITNATYGSDCQNATKGIEVGINQTESIRIAGELKRWIGGRNNVNRTYDLLRRKQVSLNEEKINSGLLESYQLFNKLNLENLVEIPSTKSQRSVRDKSRLRRLRRKDIDFPDNAVIDYTTLYRKPLRKPAEFIDDLGEWDALLQALHRRDDTFYVVGVGKGEHLLLPAVSHNITRPPKMALILPARSGNDSAMNDHVTLMQIDCSVVNTTIVQLKSDALPESLRKKSEERAPMFDNPKPKPTRIMNKYIVDPSVPIQNISDSHSNYSNHSQPKNVDVGQENVFASYLISKYEDTKNGAVKNKRKRKETASQK